MPRVIPFGDRILVQRRKVKTTLKEGKTDGGIYLPDTAEDRPTDLADVIEVPELTFGDKQILDNADKTVEALVLKATKGNSEALVAAFKINEFVKLKSVKEGDTVMISKYVGTDFHETGRTDDLTLVRETDIIGLVVNE